MSVKPMKDKPVIQYYDNGNIRLKEYYKEGERHRDGDKPAKIWYYYNGNKELEAYYKEGKLHREGDKPIYIWYHTNGNIKSESYYKEGKHHREGGKPARVSYDKNRNIERDYYYKEGKVYKINEYEKGSIDWSIIYNYEKYDIKFLAKYSKQMKKYMNRKEKLKVIEYKVKKL